MVFAGIYGLTNSNRNTWGISWFEKWLERFQVLWTIELAYHKSQSLKLCPFIMYINGMPKVLADVTINLLMAHYKQDEWIVNWNNYTVNWLKYYSTSLRFFFFIYSSTNYPSLSKKKLYIGCRIEQLENSIAIW